MSHQTAMSLHHVAMLPANLEESIRFYRDGIGLPLLFDAEVTADLMTLIGAPSNQTRTVFFGDPEDPNTGTLELIALAGFDPSAEAPVEFGPRRGLHLISFQVDVEATLARLRDLGLGGEPRRIRTSRSNELVAVVVDPDGTPVELLDKPMNPDLFK
jgi:catechol 2,3-dioxygenase-like lactoylglutathione lyase family enzyme